MALDPIIWDELATNRGVINRPVKPPTGADIPYVVRNPSGIWTPWLSEGEPQVVNGFEPMDCVSHALINSIEAQEYFLTGKQVHYSKRRLAQKSKTQRDGNYLQTVADTAKEGLVREETWPVRGNTWETFYAQPTKAEEAILLAEEKAWTIHHKLDFGFIETTKESMMKYILQCPPQIVFPSHSTMNYKTFTTPQEIVYFFDSYNPWLKQIQRSALTDAARPVLTMKNMIRLINDNGTIWLAGDTGRMGMVDMKTLETFKKLDSAPIENGSTTGLPTIILWEFGVTGHQ